MQQRAIDRTAAADAVVEAFRAFVHRSGGRLTPTRVRMMQAACNMKGHFKPEELARALRRRGHKVSVVTVYRSLPLLIEAGIVRRACFAEETGGAVYEHVWAAAHHDHLVCTRCGRTVEFSYPAIEVLQEAVAREHGFELRRHHLELVGVCAGCRGEEAR